MKRLPAALIAAVAVATALAPAVTAAADTTPTVPGAPAWSVQASGATGSDGRASFAYGVKPGTEIDDYVSVTNVGGAVQTFNIYGTDGITQYDTGLFGLLTAAQKAKDVGSWITPKVTQLTVQPGQTAIVPVVILVPSDASPGDHTGGIVASVTTAAPGTKGQPGVGIDQRVAARVYLRVSGQPVGGAAATGVVVAFSPSLNPFGTGDATVDYDIKNTGNVREDATSQLTLSGPFGVILGSAKAKTVDNLLPGESTHVHQKISGVFPLALLFANLSLTPSAPTDLIGQSKLRDEAGNPLPPLKEPSFVTVRASAFTGAVSWTLLLLLVIVAAAVFLVARYVRTTRERMFEAIDAATEQARREAIAEAETREKATAGSESAR